MTDVDHSDSDRLSVTEKVGSLLVLGLRKALWLVLVDGSVDTGEKSGKEPTNKWSNEVGVIVMRQVSIVVVERLSLEDGQGECDSGVE